MTRRQHATAIHEAGHAVAAIVHNIPFKYVTIAPVDKLGDGLPFLGHIHGEQPPARYRASKTKNNPTSLHYWHRKLIVILAGPAAHKKLHPHAHWLGYAWSDISNASNLIDDINRGKGSNAVTSAHYAYIEALATACVESNWRQIEAVAAELIKHNTLTEKDVRRTIWLNAPEVARP
jgi:hypothetical protein